MVRSSWRVIGVLTAALAFSPASHAQVVVTSTVTNSIPAFLDGSTAANRYFDFGAPIGAVTNVNFSISFSKAAVLSDDPPFYDGFALILNVIDKFTFTALKSVALIDFGSFSTGLFGDSFNGILNFTDLAPSFVNANADALTPGTVKPVNPLGGFIGEPLANYWSLQLVTGTTGAPLNYFNSALTVSFVAVPEPSTYGLIGAFALGLFVLLRRKTHTST